ncbi:single-stranded DNA-binding protein [Clostridium sp. CX1]|nr:single-stranded DNA-binding protein [Clostridium sp. CX1]MCT8978677.1 single-stranded DNA-binding protein [Clostridium sp. CX1]
MNRVVLIGRLVRDPELKFTPNTGTAVASFTLAVDRMRANKEGEREADFIAVVVFGKQAEAVANYVGKGKLIGVSGRIQTRSYEAKDGGKRHVTEVVADETQFIEWGRKAEQQASQVGEYCNDLTPVDDGDIPF